MGYFLPAGSNLSNRFECKEAERSLEMERERRRDGKKGTRAGGRGESARRMGEGLFVHASNSLGVISIARSIIVPFEEEKKCRDCTTL